MHRRAARTWLTTLALILGARAFARADDARGAVPDGTVAVIAPAIQLYYLQYGVSLVAEVVAAPGPICAATTEACILGSGGGVSAHVGGRIPSGWYFGGAYEFSKQDPDNLYRLAILQQFRAEVRRYVITGKMVEPYLLAAAGIGAYGNAWAIDTWGPMGSLGVGAEAQLSRTRVLGFSLAYRLVYLQGFTDSSGTPREAGFAHLIGLDIVLEARDPL